MTTETSDSAPLFERFRVKYPSGTTFDSHYPTGATLREAQVGHVLAKVEPVDESRVSP